MGRISSRHKMPLDCLRGVIAERGRIYRLYLNGHLDDAAARTLTDMLDGIRRDIESQRDFEAVHGKMTIEHEHEQESVGNTSIVIRPIPSGYHIAPDGAVVDGETARVQWDQHRAEQRKTPPAGVPAMLKVIDQPALDDENSDTPAP